MENNHKAVNRKVHRLVAIAFIPNPHNHPEVNHINGVRTDFRVGNLSWVSRKENMQHSWDTGLRSRVKTRQNKIETVRRWIKNGDIKLSDIL